MNPVTNQDIAITEKRFVDELRKNGNTTVQTKFEYAWLLINSTDTKDIKRGIGYMEDLTKIPDRRRECLFFVAMGNKNIGELSKARLYATELLKEEPNNQQALKLLQEIENKFKKDATIGLTIAGVVVAAGAVILAATLRK